MRRSISIVLLGLAGVAQSQEQLPTPPDLPATELAVRWLDQDPGVREAVAGLSAAGHTARSLKASPYEWSLRASPQLRQYDQGPDSHEWSVALERPIRLPGKASAERSLGDVELELAQARLGEARHEAARSLLSLWMAWLSAVQDQALTAEQVKFAESNFKAVETRNRAGDAATIEVNVAGSDLSQLQSELSRTSTEVAKAHARLTIRFPGVAITPPPLSVPGPVTGSEPDWKDKVLATSDPLKIAQLEARKAQLTASRAKAERLPDPTLALYTASEVYGNERVLGMNVVIPLPGEYRRERASAAQDWAAASEAARDREQRLLEIEIAEGYKDATGNYERWRLAEEGAKRAADNAALAQRAYSLGEADLQTLLLARRQSLDVSRSALDARVAALRSYYRLLVDAHEIWNLAHEGE